MYSLLCFTHLARSSPTEPQTVLEHHDPRPNRPNVSADPFSLADDGDVAPNQIRTIRNTPAGDCQWGSPFRNVIDDPSFPVARLRFYTGNLPGDHWGVVGVDTTWPDAEGGYEGTEYWAGDIYAHFWKAFEFYDDERITDFWVFSGSMIDNVMFKTNKGRDYNPEGGGDGALHVMNVGNGVLIGFEGQADAFKLHCLAPVFQSKG